MGEDEKFLRDLSIPEDDWVLGGQQWYTAAEVAKHLAVSDEYVRRLAERGAVPGAIMHDVKRIGWRLPRSGLIAYIAAQRRATQHRGTDAS